MGSLHWQAGSGCSHRVCACGEQEGDVLRLARYLINSMLGAVLMVMLVLLVLGGLFSFIGEQGSIGVGRYSTFQALTYTIMGLPRFALDALPVGTLIGAMLGIGALAKSNEIVAMRAAGLSKLRMVIAAIIGGALVLCLALLVGEYVAPRLERLADERKAFAKYDDISFAGQGGAWVRDGNTLINVDSQSSDSQFGNLMMFELNDSMRVSVVGQAARATNSGGESWILSDYRESRFTDDRIASRLAATRELRSATSAGFLQLAVQQPAQMALQSLRTVIAYRRANLQDAGSYELAFWSRIARLAALLVAMVFAIPFGFGLLRSSGTGARVTLGLAIGLLYFFLQQIVENGAKIFALSPLLVAWIPTLLLAIAASVLLTRAR
jgi:lipopolysaccharide export system permease protein